MLVKKAVCLNLLKNIFYVQRKGWNDTLMKIIKNFKTMILGVPWWTNG